MATICTFFTFSVFAPKLGGSVGPWEVLCLELCCDGNDGEAFPFLAHRGIVLVTDRLPSPRPVQEMCLCDQGAGGRAHR